MSGLKVVVNPQIEINWSNYASFWTKPSIARLDQCGSQSRHDFDAVSHARILMNMSL